MVWLLNKSLRNNQILKIQTNLRVDIIIKYLIKLNCSTKKEIDKFYFFARVLSMILFNLANIYF